jgi:Flp pilus assembly protein TadD
LNYKEKQYSKSEEFTSEAIGLDPISADSFILLGQIQLKQDKPKQAVQSFRHAVELNPYDPTYHTSYGIVLKMVGDCAGANTQFNEALALSPTDAITHIQMLGGCRAAGTPSNNPSTKSN